MTPLRHYGKNSMPMFTLFEKRFYRPEGQDPNAPRELCGANFQRISPLTGPGYFVVTPHPSRANEVDVDSFSRGQPTGQYIDFALRRRSTV